MIEVLLAWSLSCSQYHGAIERLYADPFFQKPEQAQERRNLHDFFKSKTWPECLEIES